MATRPVHDHRRGVFVVGHSVYSALLPIPIVCFIGALLTDLAYANSENFTWIDFSSWLLLAGLIGGAVAGLVLIVDVLRGRGRSRVLIWHLGLLSAAWVTELLNSFVHTRDGWTAVVPAGLTLSVIAVVLSLLAGWFWQSAAHVRPGDVA